MAKYEGKTTKTRIVHLNAIMTDIGDYVEKPGGFIPNQQMGRPISTVQAYRILNHTVIYGIKKEILCLKV